MIAARKLIANYIHLKRILPSRSSSFFELWQSWPFPQMFYSKQITHLHISSTHINGTNNKSSWLDFYFFSPALFAPACKLPEIESAEAKCARAAPFCAAA